MQDTLAVCGMEHPDFILLKEKERRAICCLLMEGAADDAPSALEPLHAFYVYRSGSRTAVLLSLPEEEEGFLGRLEEQLAGLGLCAGLSGPFALAQSAHGCMRKAQIALESGKPFLFLWGESDFQVDRAAFDAWRERLGEDERFVYRTYPGLNHLFMLAGEDDSILNAQAAYQQPKQMDAQVASQIAAWIAAQ